MKLRTKAAFLVWGSFLLFLLCTMVVAMLNVPLIRILGTFIVCFFIFGAVMTWAAVEIEKFFNR